MYALRCVRRLIFDLKQNRNMWTNVLKIPKCKGFVEICPEGVQNGRCRQTDRQTNRQTEYSLFALFPQHAYSFNVLLSSGQTAVGFSGQMPLYNRSNNGWTVQSLEEFVDFPLLAIKYWHSF